MDSGLALAFAGVLALGQAGPALLLDVARAAKEAGDAVRLEAAMRGWATTTDDPALPRGLEAEAERALAFAKDKGRLQLFATKLPDRLHLGVHDPAEVVGRVDVFLEKDGERTRLRRLEDEDLDRLEYALDPEVIGTVVIEAVATRFGADMVVKRIDLGGAGESELPAAPDLRVLEKHLERKHAAQTPPPKREEQDPLPWWIIAGAAIALALVGAAVWQETR